MNNLLFLFLTIFNAIILFQNIFIVDSLYSSNYSIKFPLEYFCDDNISNNANCSGCGYYNSWDYLYNVSNFGPYGSYRVCYDQVLSSDLSYEVLNYNSQIIIDNLCFICNGTATNTTCNGNLF